MLPDLGSLAVQSSYYKLVMDTSRPNKLGVLSVTNMTTGRKDGHPSMYNVRSKNDTIHHQDCSHWSLPGVPDLWNELIYALFLKQELSKPQGMKYTWQVIHKVAYPALFCKKNASKGFWHFCTQILICSCISYNEKKPGSILNLL